MLTNLPDKFRAIAHWAIANRSRYDSYSAIFDDLVRHGAKRHDVKNAKQLTDIYVEYVKSGDASEDWFMELNYPQAVLVNRATRNVGASMLRSERVFDGRHGSWRKITMFAEHKK